MRQCSAASRRELGRKKLAQGAAPGHSLDGGVPSGRDERGGPMTSCEGGLGGARRLLSLPAFILRCHP
jgi:hypothetical protein